MSPIHQLCAFLSHILRTKYWCRIIEERLGFFPQEEICTNSRRAISPRCHPKTNWCDGPHNNLFRQLFFRSLPTRFRCYFLFFGYFVGTATWSQVGGYHANGGYKGLTRPPGRAVPVANHHQPNNCPACLAAQEVPLAYLQHSYGYLGYLWVPFLVPLGIPGLQHRGLLGTTAILSPESPWSPWLWSSWWSPSYSSPSPQSAPHCFCSAG